jgi:hypothetical protein
MAKFIQFKKTANSNEYFNVNAITKIIKWHSDDTNYKERLSIFILGQENHFSIDQSHPQWDYLSSIMEDYPDK